MKASDLQSLITLRDSLYQVSNKMRKGNDPKIKGALASLDDAILKEAGTADGTAATVDLT